MKNTVTPPLPRHDAPPATRPQAAPTVLSPRSGRGSAAMRRPAAARTRSLARSRARVPTMPSQAQSPNTFTPKPRRACHGMQHCTLQSPRQIAAQESWPMPTQTPHASLAPLRIFSRSSTSSTWPAFHTPSRAAAEAHTHSRVPPRTGAVPQRHHQHSCTSQAREDVARITASVLSSRPLLHPTTASSAPPTTLCRAPPVPFASAPEAPLARPTGVTAPSSSSASGPIPID